MTCKLPLSVTLMAMQREVWQGFAGGESETVHVRFLRWVRLAAGYSATGLMLSLIFMLMPGWITAQAPAASAPTPAPAVVPQTVQPAAPVNTSPNWNGTNQSGASRGTAAGDAGRPGGRNGNDGMQGEGQNGTGRNGNPNAARNGTDESARSRPQDQPSAFQNFVTEAVGAPLPIFGANLFDEAPSTFAPVGTAQVSADYVVGPDDEVRISTSGQVSQQGSFVVSRAGTIDIPGVGAVPVAGLRFSQLQPFLRQQLGRVYRNFELTVTLGQLRSIQVYVFGQARRPGLYTVSSLSTLLNAVFASGGPLPQGSLRHIQLRRGSTLIVELDLYDLLLKGDKSKDVPLQPGDVIFLPAIGPEVAVAGAVTTPAIYELRDETTLAELLHLANGLTHTAAGTAVRIESIYERRERAIASVDLTTHSDYKLKDGDIVTAAAVNERFHDAVTLRGNVASPGRYVWHEGMKLSELFPDRDSLITRNYWRQRNLLGLPTPPYLPAEGRVAVSTTPSRRADAATAAGSGPVSGGVPANEPPSPTRTNLATANGGGTTIGDALTQSSGTFGAVNDVVLSAPDIDLAYAVIERQEPVTLSTSLIPFQLGKLVNDHDATQDLELKANDVVTIFSKADIRVPTAQQTRYVRLEGEFVGAGVYSVLPGETLRSLIRRAGGLSPDAYLFASEFTRQSTRRIEQQRIAEFADSLDSQINGQVNAQAASTLDAADAASLNQSAETARRAVARLRSTQANGRIVLKLNPDARGLDALPDIALEDGDRFIVPQQPNSVSVAGQVYNAGASIFRPSLQVRHYLRDAGGPDRFADEKRIFVIRADGSVVSSQYSHVAKAAILPGDTVVVPPRLFSRNILREVVAITNIVGQLSVTGAVIGLLR